MRAILAAAMLSAASPAAAQDPEVAAQLAAQARQIAALEADLAALRALVSGGPRGSVLVGGPRSDRVELRASNSSVVVEHDKVTIDAKRVTINGITIRIDGLNAIALDAPSIAIKGAGLTPLKGAKLPGN